MKDLPDKTVERELRKWVSKFKSLEHLAFVGKGGTIVDVK